MNLLVPLSINVSRDIDVTASAEEVKSDFTQKQVLTWNFLCFLGQKGFLVIDCLWNKKPYLLKI